MEFKDNTVYLLEEKFFKKTLFGRELLHVQNFYVITSFSYRDGNQKPYTELYFDYCDEDGNREDRMGSARIYFKKEMSEKKIKLGSWIEEKSSAYVKNGVMLYRFTEHK